MKNNIFLILMLAIIMMVTAATAIAQSKVTATASVVSESYWRGIQHNTYSLQSGIALTTQEFQFGVWGDFGAKNNYSEVDLWAKFSPSENFYVLVTDYQYPFTNSDAFNFEDKNTGAHFPEVGIGVDVAGLSLYGSAFVYNDTTYSPYFQGVYAFKVNDIPVSLFAGGAYGKTCMYNTSEENKVQFVNVGVTVAPTSNLSVTYLVNPNEKTNFVVFKLSLL